MQRLFRRLSTVESISRRLRLSFRVLVILLVVPAIVSIAAMLSNNMRYNAIIAHMGQVGDLKPKVAVDIPDEAWSAVAGYEAFDDVRLFEMIHEVNVELDVLMGSMIGPNQLELTAARRAMDTLREKVVELGQQIEGGAPVVDNEAKLEEIRDVAALVAEMLENYIAVEIDDAIEESAALNRMMVISLLLEFALLVLALALSVYAQRGLSRAIRAPIGQLEHFAGLLAAGDLRARAPQTRVAELSNLTESFNVMAGRLEELMEQSRREQENLKKSELRALQAQINPHFLYNTLDAIVWLAESGSTDEVVHITRALSDFFRISLSQGRDWIEVAEELKHLRGYFTIQKVRYRDILDYEIDVPPEAQEGLILKLLLQPLVENAIYHGIKFRRRGGKVRVVGRREGEQLHFAVIDNGPGMTEERLLEVISSLGEEDASAGYGLSNVDRRIRLYYGIKQGLRIHSDSEGTRVEFILPVRRQASDV